MGCWYNEITSPLHGEDRSLILRRSTKICPTPLQQCTCRLSYCAVGLRGQASPLHGESCRFESQWSHQIVIFRSSSIGRILVSKTSCWEFESLLRCQFIFLACRSAVDQVTVNHSVVGSIPTTPANFADQLCSAAKHSVCNLQCCGAQFKTRKLKTLRQ